MEVYCIMGDDVSKTFLNTAGVVEEERLMAEGREFLTKQLEIIPEFIFETPVKLGGGDIMEEYSLTIKAVN